MRRNNIFMLSYIAFIFFCLVVRVCYKFPMWNTLVAAISFSSGVFAFADFYSGLATAELAAYKITKELFTNIEKSITDQLQEVDKRLTEELVAESSTKQKADIRIEVKSSLTKFSDENESIKKMYKENDRLRKKHGNLATVLNFLGYFSFFIVLVFQSASSVLSLYLDLLSVLAFGMILSTQYMTGYYEDRIEKQKADARKVNYAVIEYLEALEKYIDSKGNLVSVTEQEEIDYAD